MRCCLSPRRPHVNASKSPEWHRSISFSIMYYFVLVTALKRLNDEQTNGGGQNYTRRTRQVSVVEMSVATIWSRCSTNQCLGWKFSSLATLLINQHAFVSFLFHFNLYALVLLQVTTDQSTVYYVHVKHSRPTPATHAVMLIWSIIRTRSHKELD